MLATGNKSELAVGYSTIYGDAVGGFAPIKDVPKTLVWELSRWRNDRRPRAAARSPRSRRPPSTSRRAPSCGPVSSTATRCPTTRCSTACSTTTWSRTRGAAELVAAGFDAALVERVLRLVDRAEYKRRQYPPGTKISPRNFGRDRRLPITSRWREQAVGTAEFDRFGQNP